MLHMTYASYVTNASVTSITAITLVSPLFPARTAHCLSDSAVCYKICLQHLKHFSEHCIHLMNQRQHACRFRSRG